MGRRRKARELAQEGVRLLPDDQLSRLMLSRVHLLNGDLGAGRAEAEAAFALKPDSLMFMDAIGYMLILLGDWERGEKLILRAIELNPEYATAYNNRGNARKAQGGAVVVDHRDRRLDQPCGQCLRVGDGSRGAEELRTTVPIRRQRRTSVESTDPAHDRRRWLPHAATGARGDWSMASRQSGAGQVARRRP